MAELTPQEKETLVAALKKFPYLCSISGGTGSAVSLGPLSAAPSITGDTATNDVTLYESNGDTEASFLTKNDIKLTLKTRNVEVGIAQALSIKKNDNWMASALKKTVTLVPITSASGEKTFTFTNAYLNPGSTITPGENGTPTEVELIFTCKADVTTGVPFTFTTSV